MAEAEVQASSLPRFCFQKRCFQPNSGAGRAEVWGSAQMGLGAGCEACEEFLSSPHSCPPALWYMCYPANSMRFGV